MPETDSKAYYEDFWSRTEDQRIYGPVGRHTRRLIRRMLLGLSYKSVLDVSCGEGTMIRELFGDRDDLRIVGTDISSAALEMARRKNPGVDFRFLDLNDGPLPERFDLVVCSEVIEHVPDDENAVRVLAQMAGRYLLITTLGGRMRSHEKDIGHQRNYDPDQLERMIESNGLKVIRSYRWGWPFFSPLYRDLLNTMADRTRDLTTGSFGPGRKLMSHLIWLAFLFNCYRRGDQLVILAERPSAAPEPLKPLEETPSVSVAIPVRNEERHMRACTRGLQALDYPREKLEVIFADGGSTDATRRMALAAGFRVVDNPRGNVAGGRNAAFAAASGQVVAFTDADVLFDPQWVRNAVRRLRETGAAGVGGPTPVPADQNAFGKAAGLVFDLAGQLGATVHRSATSGVRDTDDLPGCNAFYRREALLRVMPTNTRLGTNEDVEMNGFLRGCGFRLVMAPDVSVQHYKRSTPAGFWRQMYRFAVGRVQLGRRDGSYIKRGHWAAGIGLPAAALAALLGGLVHEGVWLAAAVAAAVAVAVLLAAGTLRGSPAAGAWAVVALGVLLLAWPIGFWSGWLSPRRAGR
jgi:GT2 family glycosyltransferase/SAM-dependent methyltransferase